MVLPEFLLAKESTSRRLYIATFSQELAKTPFSAIEIANQFGGGGESGEQLGSLLRAALNHLDDDTFRQRLILPSAWAQP